jgi:hypothetical protein
MLMGAVVAVFFIYIFFFTCLIVSNQCPDKAGPKRTITFGYYDNNTGGQTGEFVDKIDLS